MLKFLIEKINENKIKEINILDKKFKFYSISDFNDFMNKNLDQFKNQILMKYKEDNSKLNGKIKLKNFKACYYKSAGFNGHCKELAEGDVYLNYNVIFISDPDTPNRDIIDIDFAIFIKNDITKKFNYPREILFYYEEF